MKIVICTIPIRPVPTDYPPLASLAIIQSLRQVGENPIFFDIDALRPSFPEVVARLKAEAPDVVGISAVVSTAYRYVKRLCQAIKQTLPRTKIVLGGNMAASAEILHRCCGVDICVIGEGERVIVNLVNHYRAHGHFNNHEGLRQIKGISFLDDLARFVFTGYEEAIPASDFLDPDFSILEKESNIDLFIRRDYCRQPSFAKDPRSSEPHRAGKTMAVIQSTKGCVARCTFCHRWDKGFRQIPPEKVVARIKYLIDRYNVGFIRFGDENFGSDRKATEKLIQLIRPLDVLWKVGGIRACSVDLDLLKRMRDAGCSGLYYGFESGSPDILKIMEKKLDLEDNYNAARWMHEAGLSTVYQLVLAMPGEDERTISETVEMVKDITEFLPDPPYKMLSISYIQALPGTPVYEYARFKGLIGASLEEEERYLLDISDVDQGDDTKFLNFTSYPYLTVQSWRMRILYEATVHWYRHRLTRGLEIRLSEDDVEDWSYFNRHAVVRRGLWLLEWLYPLRRPLIFLWTLRSVYCRIPLPVFLQRLWEWVTWRFREHETFSDFRSLRHVMRDFATKPTTQDRTMMMPLRLGR